MIKSRIPAWPHRLDTPRRTQHHSRSILVRIVQPVLMKKRQTNHMKNILLKKKKGGVVFFNNVIVIKKTKET